MAKSANNRATYPRGDTIKEQNERAIGDKFFTSYYNGHHATNFTYKGRPDQAPDLTYGDGDAELNIEVATAYYDCADAESRWATARGLTHTVVWWSGVNFEDQVVGNVNAVIERKCRYDYGAPCLLVVHVRPPLTTIEEMRERLGDIRLPSGTPFDGIYLSGDFPDSYSCWRIDTSPCAG